MDLRSLLRCPIVYVCLLAFGVLRPSRVDAQSSGPCRTDRVASTLVGAGLGLAAGAIPATIVHRHDQASSHRIVGLSITAGALIGFVAAGRDSPCTSRADSAPVANAVVAKRATRAVHGALAGAAIGAVLGAVGGTLYNTGCERDPCHGRATSTNLVLFSAGEGALAGGILGSLIGWAWPMRR